ncbi:PEP-CTERM sorting domain-containing protein [Cerasicoccus frondis]|uniref:PEP-CTERM sorting domain-containing protein n=1 Tax=Cerasicoccus frondis TaxID=490090 RepID=UPI002852B1A7|nr:PEP-CTERM sorting domain-containing protein [Cerasicoccus frondis]
MKNTTVLPLFVISVFCSISLNAQTRNYGYSFSTPETLATDVASWNYTLDTSYSGSGDPGSTANMFIVRGESGSSDHSIVSIAGETAYYVRTANSQNTNFGFYLMNLDFTDFTSGQDVLVSYSFKILGNDTNGGINPNDWEVRYTEGTTGVGVSSYTDLAQTFSFQDDNQTWTSISGTFIVSSASDRGGILINAGTSGSGYTSSGGYYLADYIVEVSSIPEPSSFALFGAVLMGVLVVGRRSVKRKK